MRLISTWLVHLWIRVMRQSQIVAQGGSGSFRFQLRISIFLHWQDCSVSVMRLIRTATNQLVTVTNQRLERQPCQIMMWKALDNQSSSTIAQDVSTNCNISGQSPLMIASDHVHYVYTEQSNQTYRYDRHGLHNGSADLIVKWSLMYTYTTFVHRNCIIKYQWQYTLSQYIGNPMGRM